MKIKYNLPHRKLTWDQNIYMKNGPMQRKLTALYFVSVDTLSSISSGPKNKVF